ncbi:hypothetical protein NUW58_g2329 [Xylaria curta]|uniref:Uncharacterized protein n=1 Tax=Xylaria curta TaxID=42375 RepID=A0ACC1PHG7_9PEZI|nr:hypothetical protein NUW58_g2329 [Xylaria curta]
MADAMGQWPNSEENDETGFALANDSNKSMFDIFADHPDRAEKATMVDVGGSHGSVAVTIAERFPNMTCIFRDLLDVVAEGEAQLPSGLGGGITFMA